MNEKKQDAEPDGEITVYESAEGGVRVEVRLERDTVWLTQRQMAEMFSTTPENILMHLRNIFTSGELEKASTSKEYLVVRSEGQRRVRRTLKHYNLDAIVSVGFRVKSSQGVRFRQWATRTLCNHLVAGYTLNEHRLADRSLREVREKLDLLARNMHNNTLVENTGQVARDLIADYVDTWRLLLAYDEDQLMTPSGVQPSTEVLDHDRVVKAIAELRRELMVRKEASSLFGNPRGNLLAAILGNIEQTMFGENLYRSREERRRIYCILSSRTIPFPTATSASVPCCFCFI